jgi:signal transduction histidine kinase/CheY-like chemotaxis protein
MSNDVVEWMLAGGGEAAALMRRVDWASTPLGPMTRWPESLRTTVATMLHSRHPMFLWWGPELIQVYNDAYVPSFGVGKHPAAMGQRGRECWPEIWPIIGPQIEDVMERGQPSWHEDALVPIFRNGAIEEVYWTYGYSAVFDADGGIAGTLVVCTETTARVLATREEAATRAQADRAKDEFLATASHELRTPLNAILGWARLLQMGQLDPSGYLRAVDTIERNARAQVRLIEDILDGSRIITGNLHLEIRPLDLTVLVYAALDAVRPAAEAKRIALSVAVAPEAARVVGDPERLQQVVWNLANNAIKFTDKGGTVAVGLSRVGTDIELQVRDTGQGIDAAFLPHVFERFRQAEGGTTRRYGGLGLGLALVRHLVEAHGGTVAAASDGPGRGAVFTVRLPVQAVLAEPPEASVPQPAFERPQAAAAASLVGVTVLVVDDEADAQELVATALRAQGARVTTAGSAAEALARIEENAFMAMVSDIGMAGSDGYELISRVRTATGARGVHLPALALTAYSREEDRRHAFAAGFQSYASKPVDPADLVRLVAGLVAGSAPAPRGTEAAVARADALAKFERILRAQGVHEALRFLNSRTAYRFTGVYRFDPPTLRSVLLLDADTASVTRGDDAPMEATYCSIVGATERAFTTEDATRDDRLRTHPARDAVLSYTGVLLRGGDGAPFGTLCHFDFVPCDVPVREVALMEAVAPSIMRALADGAS